MWIIILDKHQNESKVFTCFHKWFLEIYISLLYHKFDTTCLIVAELLILYFHIEHKKLSFLYFTALIMCDG